MGLNYADHPFLTPARQAPHHRPRGIRHRPAILSNQTSGREFPKVFRAHNRADPPLGIRSLFSHVAKFERCQGFSRLCNGGRARRGSFAERGKGEIVQVM